MPELPGYTSKLVDDFCPDISASGDGTLNIIPFSQLDDVIRNGDVVIFMARPANIDAISLFKMRGWHAELAFRNANGKAVQCAPWGGESEIQDHPCDQLRSHRHYDAMWWNLHILRMVPDLSNQSNVEKLLMGIRNWRTIYHRYTFPSGVWQFDPVDFEDIAGLEKIACELIRCERVPDMYCMQWVHAVLSLALNVPLNQQTLSRLGVLEEYKTNWSQLGFVSDDVLPFGRLPISPYTPSDLVLALNTLYLGYPTSTFADILPMIHSLPRVQSTLSGAPAYSIPPITPLSEYRKPGHTGTVTWQYVASAFDDAQCILQ